MLTEPAAHVCIVNTILLLTLHGLGRITRNSVCKLKNTATAQFRLYLIGSDRVCLSDRKCRVPVRVSHVAIGESSKELAKPNLWILAILAI